MEIFDVLNEYGEFTGKTATREECHKKGYWHRVVYAFIIDDKGNILLQKRSASKKLWPNLWDVTVWIYVKFLDTFFTIFFWYFILLLSENPSNYCYYMVDKI